MGTLVAAVDKSRSCPFSVYSTMVSVFTSIIPFSSYHYPYLCFTRWKTSKDGVHSLAQHYQTPECQDSLWHLLSCLDSSFLHPSVFSPHYFALFFVSYFVCMDECLVLNTCICVRACLRLCAEARGGHQVSCSITPYLSPPRQGPTE